MLTRRHCLHAGLALAAAAPAMATTLIEVEGADAPSLLRAGGLVVALRHALAPGVYDPPGFRLGDCGTQRNLNDEGRAQARRIGEWFKTRSLQPARVRTSPWCRCVDTAQLAFGSADVWPALGSPREGSTSDNAARLRELRQAVVSASAQRGRFEVWVTHQFVLTELVGGSAGSGEGVLLRADNDGALRVLARLPAA